MENDLKRWQEENNRRTKEGCQGLLHDLKRKHLDPILQRLTGPMGASISFDQIEDSFLALRVTLRSYQGEPKMFVPRNFSSSSRYVSIIVKTSNFTQ